jgi:hypothetical protein
MVGRNQAALACCDILRRVQRETGRVGEAADLSSAVAALERVRGVLDDGNPEREDRVEVAGLSGEMHGQDRPRSLIDGLGDALRVDVEIVVAHVDEDGSCTGVHDHVRRRRPCDRRRDHLVAGADLERDEREVQRRSSRSKREHVLRFDVVRHSAFELGGARSARQPAGAERLRNGGDLLVADRRRLKAEHRLAARGDHAPSVTAAVRRQR